MKTPQGLLLWVFGLISCDLQTFVHCFFDVDEINSVNYGIDILDVPVMLGQVIREVTVVKKTIHKSDSQYTQ